MKKMMLGNEAVARGAYEAGVKVVSSYPGTPSTEITEFSALYPEIKCEWATNEKVAVETAFGASLGGVRALSCMKHVGVNVAADPLFTAAYTGVRGGLVIVCADDPAMHSSQNEQDSRQIARAAHIPMLEPSDCQEAKDMMKTAFWLSETYDTPVFVRMTTRLSHSRGVVEMAESEEVPDKPYQKDIAKYVMMPAMARKRHVLVEEREKRLQADANSLPINREEMRGTEQGVICSGVVYEYVREALPNASTLKLGLTYPLPQEMMRSFAKKVQKLYVIEELEGVIEQEAAALGLSVTGKALTGLQGELSVDRLRALFGKASTEKQKDLPARPPVLCPGCPHRATFYALKRLGLTVFGDIGCYTLGAMAPLAAIDASLCMGGSIGMAFGAEKAKGRDFSKKAVAVIGDSTFLHSGMPSLLNAVYNGGNITVVLMDNRITAMTGHQQNPGMGYNIYGQPAFEVNFEHLCEAMGAHARTVDPMHCREMVSALKEETARDGVSVIVAKSPCALLNKKHAPGVTVENCRNCGACSTIGCPAILKGQDSVSIDASLCVGCGLCSQLCPHHALKDHQRGEEASC